MVGREGVEAATMLASMATQTDARNLFWGGVLGLSCAAAMGWAWARYGRRVDLSRFFAVTAIFMVLFSIQLVFYALNEFTEIGAIPGVDNEFWHAIVEPWGPDGEYGHWLSYGLVLVPAAFLLLTWRRGRSQVPSPVAGSHPGQATRISA
jgi:high-affinity iron transporter